MEGASVKDELALVEWITSPKNVELCRYLGKEPLVVLGDLKEWYNNGGNL